MSDTRDRTEPGPPDSVYDRRVRPRGVLPRRLQTWVMLAVAAALLIVIAVTGHTTAPRRSVDTSAPSSAPSALPPERLRKYQEQLAEQEARLRQELAEA